VRSALLVSVLCSRKCTLAARTGGGGGGDGGGGLGGGGGCTAKHGREA
jgi:hypothetical protein